MHFHICWKWVPCAESSKGRVGSDHVQCIVQVEFPQCISQWRPAPVSVVWHTTIISLSLLKEVRTSCNSIYRQCIKIYAGLRGTVNRLFVKCRISCFSLALAHHKVPQQHTGSIGK